MNIMKKYVCTAKIWLYPGDNAAWHFLTLPKKVGIDIKAATEGVRRGWGSVPVTVTIGKTSWETSIFPDKHSGSFILPLKASVRNAEELEEGDEVKVMLTVRR